MPHITYDEFVDAIDPTHSLQPGTIRGGLPLDGFKLALTDLNLELIERHADPIHLRAVGGFAMMCHNLRQNLPVTLDIDTVTPDPTPEQQAAIDAVSHRLDLPTDWINNNTVFAPGDTTTKQDCAYMDDMLDAHYIPSHQVMATSTNPAIDKAFNDLTHVALDIADLETLAHAKAFAVVSIGQGRTSKDAIDFINIMKAMDILTLSAAYDQFPWMADPDFDDLAPQLKSEIADYDGFVDTRERPQTVSAFYDPEDDLYQELASILRGENTDTFSL